MRPATEACLASRLLEHIESGTTAVVNDVMTRPSSEYVDEDLQRRERSQVLLRCPTIVAHVGQLPKAGDYLAGSLHQVPFMLVRQQDGSFRSHVNVCRHRGSQLVPTGRANAAANGFTCPWHGWRYGLGGDLCAIPDGERGFPELNEPAHHLEPIHTEVRHGFVWLTLTPEADPSVSAFLGALDDELSTYGIEHYMSYGTSSQTARFNWKLGIEAFLETYHFRWLHPAMKKYVFAPDLSLVDCLDRHVRLVAPKKSILENRELPPAERRLRRHATVAYGIFPGTMLFVEKRHMSVMQMHGVTPDLTEVEFLHIVAEDTLSLRDYWDDNIGKFLEAADQDFSVLEPAQRGFAQSLELARRNGKSEPSVIFGRNEAGVQAFRRNLDAYMCGADRALAAPR